MQSRNARQAMLDVAAAGGDVAEGALWLAAEDWPEVEPARWLERIDELSAELRTRCGIDGCRPSDAPLVASLLRDRLRLHGAGGGDPRAHYLHTVLERGAGIPIACSAIWIAVGQRADIPIQGVNLPGHFLVRVGNLLFDTIAGGEPLDDDDTRRLVADSTGTSPARLEPSWLAGATTRDMLARMSRNLRGCYSCLEDWPLALRAADRCVDLLPDEPTERRDRGFLLWRMGHPTAALEDLRHYLDAAPADVADRDAVEEIASRLRAFLN
ncbi:MAG TPA: tetratricopeptide repeat protein [Candidatus Dormibacteraeota bacterium]